MCIRDRYSSELLQALLKASNYKLDERIAQTVAEGYARNLDYSDLELMHIGVTSVANNLLTKIKREYFISVSYTHLDVYKRQELKFVLGQVMLTWGMFSQMALGS